MMLATVLLAALPAWAADDLPAQARAALEQSTTYMRSISTEGGYLWKYSLDLKERAGEVKATASQVWIQPPGTPTMGMTFLRCYEVAKDARYLDAARGAALALAAGQLESGGWDYVIEFDPVKRAGWHRRTDKGKISEAEAAKRKNISTYDDDTTQSGLRFLLAFAAATKGSTDPRDAEVRTALDYGLKKLLEAQYPNGAWPQRWRGEAHAEKDFPVVKARYPASYPREYPKVNYFAHYTLNDNSLHDCIGVMLDAFHRTGRREYLESAKRGGDFLILAQLPEPQPAWAQQYNAQMEPAWARAFEPPAVTGGESVGALRMLMELYVETGEEKFLKPVPPALAWFKRSEISPNRWARYYELQTNKQIFGDRDGKIYYRLADISEERQGHYSWSGDYGVRNLTAYYEKLQSKGRAALLKEQANKTAGRKTKLPAAAPLESRVREIIAALDGQGRWVTRGHVQHRNWEFNDRVETSVFIKNAEALASYLEAVGH
ncbi:MAG: pectic acid lyase [Verrucomicrobia bacterium]|nr:pectic acid lyase [Verrucomicrobiota bacterium]